MKRSFQIAIVCSALGASVLAAAARQDSKSSSSGDAAKGKEVFDQCAVCHNVDTDEKKIGPSLKGLFKQEKLVNGKKVTEENVREFISNGGNGMPAYADMLSKDDMNNVIAYLKTI